MNCNTFSLSVCYSESERKEEAKKRLGNTFSLSWFLPSYLLVLMYHFDVTNCLYQVVLQRREKAKPTEWKATTACVVFSDHRKGYIVLQRNGMAKDRLYKGNIKKGRYSGKKHIEECGREPQKHVQQ